MNVRETMGQRSSYWCGAVALLMGIAVQASAGPLDEVITANGPLRAGDVVAFLGDSITQAGAGPNGYVSLIEKAAEKHNLGVKIVKAGISGHKVPDLQARLDRDVLAHKPTVVFIYIGINDVWHSERGRGTPKDKYEAGLRDLIDRIRAAGAIVVLATPSVIGEKAAGENKLDEMLGEYAEISRKVAADKKVTLCDLHAAFRDHLKQNNPENKDRGILTTDGVHLNAEGNKLVAQRAAEAIVAALRTARSTSAEESPKPCACSDGAVVSVADADGFVSLFDGKSLDGWDGDPKFWRVEEGVIVGETTAENPTKQNTFLIWRGGKPADFELKIEFRLHNHNSGVQYRSWEEPEKWGKWVIGGYQADIEGSGKYMGICYGERYRGILAQRGEKTVIGEDHKPKVVGKIGEADELLKKVDLKGWNEFHIVARGFKFTQAINGQLMVEVVDEDTQQRRADGLIALQLHAGPPMKVEFRNIRLKALPAGQSSQRATPQGSELSAAAMPEAALLQPIAAPAGGTQAAGKKKIVFVAGRKSHGFLSHDHYPGCRLLAKWIAQAAPGTETVVVQDGWPKDPSVFDGAAAIVVFADGGGGNPILQGLDVVEKLTKQGVGLACLHYAVEVPKERAGPQMLDWIGGYFETHWSVNPHWKAEFREFPKHPVANGLKPFAIDDEWYYHMRFREEMKGVTPILSAVPPDSTRQRPDGPHSNNPTVRARLGMAEHLAWAAERPDGGRGFGFTGGHWHYNWAEPNFRKCVLNGIAWVAKIDIPPEGIVVKTPTIDELKENADEPIPEKFDWAKIERLIEQWNP